MSPTLQQRDVAVAQHDEAVALDPKVRQRLLDPDGLVGQRHLGVWLNSEELGAYLRRSPRAAYMLARREHLPAYRMGHRLLYRRAEVDALIARRRLG